MLKPDPTTVTILLVAHLLADFVLQTRSLLERKRQAAGLAEHALHHAAASSVLLGPAVWWGGAAPIAALSVVTALALGHALIDAAKARGPERYRHSASGFLIDQGLHVATIVGAALLLSPHGVAAPDAYRRMLVIVGAGVALSRGSMFFVAHLVAPFATPDSGHHGAGRTIGILERAAIALFVWFGEWGAAGFILAAKSLARFKDLDDRRFAEYYLVGTLGSVLAAVAVALAARALW